MTEQKDTKPNFPQDTEPKSHAPELPEFLQQMLGKMHSRLNLTAAIQAVLIQYKTRIMGIESDPDTWHCQGVVNMNHSYPVNIGGKAIPLAAVEVVILRDYVMFEMTPMPYMDLVPEDCRGVALDLGYVDVATKKVTVTKACRLKVPVARQADIEHGMCYMNARTVGCGYRLFNLNDLTVATTVPIELLNKEDPCKQLNDVFARLLSFMVGSGCYVYNYLVKGGDWSYYADIEDAGEDSEKAREYCRAAMLSHPYLLDAHRKAFLALDFKNDKKAHDKLNELTGEALQHTRNVRIYGDVVGLPLQEGDVDDMLAKAATGEDWKSKGCHTVSSVIEGYRKDAESMHTLMFIGAPAEELRKAKAMAEAFSNLAKEAKAELDRKNAEDAKEESK